MQGLTLDSGALIALERKDDRMKALLDRMLSHPDTVIHIPAGVLAQVFRDGSKQVRLARLLKKGQARVVVLDEDTARAAGILIGLRGTDDVVDASVVICARRYHQSVVTGDPEDLRVLDASLDLQAI